MISVTYEGRILKRYFSWLGSSFTLSSLLQTKAKLGERLSI
jgi:hypothetical protein